MHKFAFLKTWPCSKNIYERGHVLRYAKFCIQRQIKNFTRNDFPKLLFLCTATYGSCPATISAPAQKNMPLPIEITAPAHLHYCPYLLAVYLLSSGMHCVKTGARKTFYWKPGVKRCHQTSFFAICRHQKVFLIQNSKSTSKIVSSKGLCADFLLDWECFFVWKLWKKLCQSALVFSRVLRDSMTRYFCRSVGLSICWLVTISFFL